MGPRPESVARLTHVILNSINNQIDDASGDEVISAVMTVTSHVLLTIKDLGGNPAQVITALQDLTLKLMEVENERMN